MENGTQFADHMLSTWQPIETAPKELLRCLLFCPEKVRISRHDDGIVMGRFMYGQPYGDGMNGDWVFTHWMPLPEPPAQGMARDSAETEGLRPLRAAKPGPKDAPPCPENPCPTYPLYDALAEDDDILDETAPSNSQDKSHDPTR